MFRLCCKKRNIKLHTLVNNSPIKIVVELCYSCQTLQPIIMGKQQSSFYLTHTHETQCRDARVCDITKEYVSAFVSTELNVEPQKRLSLFIGDSLLEFQAKMREFLSCDLFILIHRLVILLVVVATDGFYPIVVFEVPANGLDDAYFKGRFRIPT